MNIDGDVKEGTRVKVTFYGTVLEIGTNFMEIEDEDGDTVTARSSYWIEEAEW